MFIWLSIRPALIGVEGGHDVSWEPTGPNSIMEVDQHGNQLFPGAGQQRPSYVFQVSRGTVKSPLTVGTVSGGLDGFGHLGFAARDGLRPFGRDVINRAGKR